MFFKKKLLDIFIKKIQKSKQNAVYSIDANIDLFDFINILFQRSTQAFRGICSKPFIGHVQGLLFKGKNVKILHAAHLKIGKNVILEDNTFLNALSLNGINLGSNVTIQRDSILICTGVIRQLGQGIKIGDGCGINARAYLGGQGGITIGNNVIIGPDVKIFSENHIFSDLDIPIKNQGESREGVKINDDCWIGAGAIILDGVEIGKGCVVAAGAVVTKSFLPYSIIGGVPAKLIKYRHKKVLYNSITDITQTI